MRNSREALTPFTAVLLAGVLGWQLGYGKGREHTPAPAVVERLQLDTVYVRDTVTLWRTTRRVDTLTQSVERWKTDTLAVVEYVALADSGLRACANVVRGCEARVALERRIAENATQQARQTLTDAKRMRWVWALAGFGIGSITGALRR